MKQVLPATLLACISGIAAQADQINLTAPMQGASLHEGGVDMAVYFLDQKDVFEVVATYVDTTEPYDPARLRMGLTDGDAVHFSLPGLRHVFYTFERTGDSIRVSAEPSSTAIAQSID